MALELEQFAKYWQDIHEDMNVTAEIPYYYDCYQQLEALVEDDGDYVNGGVIWLLLYVEDLGGLKLGKWNMEHYHVTANWLDISMEDAGYDMEDWDKVRSLLLELGKHTPKSGVKRYVRDAVLDLDFDKLWKVIKWYFKNYPGYLDCMPGQETGEYLHEHIFKNQDMDWCMRFVDTDDAFCWKAKDGKTIIQRLADGFEGKEYMEVRNNLLAMRAHTVDAYRVLEVLEDGLVVIEDYKRKMKGTVALSQPFLLEASGKAERPKSHHDLYLVGDLVEWDKWYMPEPYAWIPKVDMAGFEREAMLEELRQEQIWDSKHGITEDVYGNQIDVYKDLYVL